MLEDFMELLIDRGHDVADMVRGPFVDALTGAPDADSQTALVTSAAPTPPTTYHGQMFEGTRINIQVRRADGVEARSRAALLHADLAGLSGVAMVADATAGDSVFKEVIPQNAPVWIDEDPHGRHVYGFSVEVWRRDAGS
jgi:hypothetical protein